jgi:hypothetical protein
MRSYECSIEPFVVHRQLLLEYGLTFADEAEL